MQHTGLIRIVVGLILVLGAVGGMDNPDQAHYWLEQTAIAVVGLALMWWAVISICCQADST